MEIPTPGQGSSRRNFLKTAAVTGAGVTLGAISAGAAAPVGATPGVAGGAAQIPPRAAGQKPVHALTTTPREKVRVGVIGLHRGLTHVRSCMSIPFAEVVAICDIFDDRAAKAADIYEKGRGQRPVIYSGNDSVWEKMMERDDIDVVYIATPWKWHVPMGLRAMERGKHAFIEVSAAVTVADCWQLVDTSERTQRHCLILENCCYGENELFVLNLARSGVLGDLIHAECAYLHDLRGVLYQLGSEGDWRRDYHTQMDGNLYPTHGLGPVAQYLGLGRGDQFKFVVSTSSKEATLTKYRDEKKPNGGKHAAEKYVCGDMNTSIIKTEMGRTIMMQHDVVLPRPYSRINALMGTSGTFFDYPARLAVDTPATHGLKAKGPEDWLGEADMKTMREKFTHPLWKKLAAAAKGSGHGGMDYVMSWRHLDCLRRGVTPDSTVYDAAAWSSLLETSVKSVAAGSMPVVIPDFTRGLWKTLQPLGIAEAS